MRLNARAAEVLREVIDVYLRSGEPVASQQVAGPAGAGMSAATARVLMGELTEAGYLEQPHTSAGRMPTGLGLRMYVDSLMRTRTPSPRQRDGIDTALRDAGPTPLEIVRAAARHLAETCHLAAVTRAPRLETRRLIGLRLLRLGAGRVMALLVFDDESVNHHTFASSSPDAVLERVMSMFHAEFVGLTLSASRARLKSDVEGLDLESRELAASALAETDSDTAEQAVVVEGRTNLVECAPDGLPLGEVLRSLEDKRLLLHVLDDMLAQQGPQVVLGTESRDLGLERCTVVAAPYFVGGARAGAVALLGPLRLEYARLVPLVNYTADSISGMLRGVPSAA
jgi:heat-inducible transcriptional repressor